MQRRKFFAAAAGGVVAGITTGAGAAGAASSGTPADAAGTADAPGVRIERSRLVSLSHVNDPANTNVFPGDPPFELETIATIPKDGYFLQYVREGEHTGTHWGAPGHFNQGEPLADELEVSDLFLPAVKIDARDKCARDPDYGLTIDDIKEWERQHGRIPDESMVIMWTGWEYRWGTPAFPNFDDAGTLHQPGFSIPAAQWLIDTGRIGRNGGTGIDTFGPDRGVDDTYTVSTLVYRRHRISLEILANLAALPTTGAYILAGGHINRHGAGSTALIFGVIPPGTSH